MGWSLGSRTGDEANAGLAPGSAVGSGDDVVAYDRASLRSAAGAPPRELFFSLAPGSPSLQQLGFHPSDILVVGGAIGERTVVVFSRTDLGLPADSNLDALNLQRRGPGAVLLDFSVDAGSVPFQYFGTLVDSAATVLRFDGTNGSVAVRAGDLGLDVEDDVDALESVDVDAPRKGPLPPPPQPIVPEGIPLSQNLYLAYERYRHLDELDAAAIADLEGMGLIVHDGKIHTRIGHHPGVAPLARRVIEDVGATQLPGRWQYVAAPLSQLQYLALALDKGMVLTACEIPHINEEVLNGESVECGPELTRADLYRDLEGLDGTGIKVAIIDQGYALLEDAQQLGHSPPDLQIEPVPSRLRADTSDEAGIHGHYCLQTVYDFVPNATFRLYDVSTCGDSFADAFYDCIENEVDIITSSVGMKLDGYHDDEGPVKAALNDAADSGILVCVGAGNSRATHWQGEIFDEDGDDWVDFGDNEGRLAVQVLRARASRSLLRGRESSSARIWTSRTAPRIRCSTRPRIHRTDSWISTYARRTTRSWRGV